MELRTYNKPIDKNGVPNKDGSLIYSEDFKTLYQFKRLQCKYQLEQDTTIICDKAFQDNNHIKTIVFNEVIEVIGNNAFCGCNNLVLREIPVGVEYIGRHAFSDCYSLTQIAIEGKITCIMLGSFQGCKNIRRINLPET